MGAHWAVHDQQRIAPNGYVEFRGGNHLLRLYDGRDSDQRTWAAKRRCRERLCGTGHHEQSRPGFAASEPGAESEQRLRPKDSYTPELVLSAGVRLSDGGGGPGWQ